MNDDQISALVLRNELLEAKCGTFITALSAIAGEYNVTQIVEMSAEDSHKTARVALGWPVRS